MITKDELITKLNKDLELEYAAAIQYIQHAATLTGPQYQSIEKELLVHADEEIGHAKMLAEQIDYLGGAPTMHVDNDFRETDPDTIKKLEQDLRGEVNAIERYKERIKEAQVLELYGLEQVLKNILAQEEEHERDLLTALNR